MHQQIYDPCACQQWSGFDVWIGGRLIRICNCPLTHLLSACHEHVALREREWPSPECGDAKDLKRGTCNRRLNIHNVTNTGSTQWSERNQPKIEDDRSPRDPKNSIQIDCAELYSNLLGCIEVQPVALGTTRTH